MFVNTIKKIVLSVSNKTGQIATKTALIHFCKNFVHDTRLQCLQAFSQITLTPSGDHVSFFFFYNLWMELPYAVIKEYSQEYFQPKIGRKIRELSFRWKKILFKEECTSQNWRSRSQTISYSDRLREVSYRIQVFSQFYESKSPMFV